MDALISALARTEWLVGFAVGAIVVVVAIVVGISTDYLIAGKTHRALLEAETKRADAETKRADKAEERSKDQIADARADAAALIAAAREDAVGEVAAARIELNHRMANYRADQGAIWQQMLTEANRRADDFKGLAHIEAEQRRISEERMSEVLEYVHLSERVLSALQGHATQARQLPAGVNDHA